MRYTDPDERPLALTVEPETIPELLRKQPQWVVWSWIWNPNRGQWDKPPRQINGLAGSSTDPGTWTSFETAHKAYLSENAPWDGIGFVLSEETGLVGVDLDDCRNPESGQLQDWALEILKGFQTYTEASPSGRGVHAFCLAKLPGSGRKRGSLEIYAEGRYLTVTGVRVSRSEEPQDRQLEVEQLWTSLESPSHSRITDAHPRATGGLNLSDQELLERAREAKNGVAFWALYTGHDEMYTSRSDADMALCNHLAFWTDRDPSRMDRLFRGSGLIRPKWDERRGESTYGENTIQKALEAVSEGFRPSAPTTPRHHSETAAISPGTISEEAQVNGVHPPGQLLLRSIAEVQDMPSAEVNWVVERFLAEGAITELTAWIKAGKSTLMAQMIACLVQDRSFLNIFAVDQGPVVLLTEERPSTLMAAFNDVGIRKEDPLHIAMWFEQRVPWEDAVTQAAQYARQIKARLLVIDTLGRWAGVEDENDAAAADRAMAPIQREAVGLAVAVLRQARKSGGEIQVAGRGSGAYGGAADIMLSLQHHRNEKGQLLEEDPNRWLSVISRFERDVVPRMRIVYRSGIYYPVEATPVLDSSAVGRILEDLMANGAAKPYDIHQRTGLKLGTVRVSLSRLLRKGRVEAKDGIYEVVFDGNLPEAAFTESFNFRPQPVTASNANPSSSVIGRNADVTPSNADPSSDVIERSANVTPALQATGPEAEV